MTLLTGPAEKTLLMLEERALCLFISLASPKKKQTNKQTNKLKERWQGHRNNCGQLQQA